MCTASCLTFFVPAGLLPLLSVFVLSLLCCALPAGLYCHERMVMSVCVRARAFVFAAVRLHVGRWFACCRVSLFTVAAFHCSVLPRWLRQICEIHLPEALILFQAPGSFFILVPIVTMESSSAKKLQKQKIPIPPPSELVPIIQILNGPLTNEFWALDREISWAIVMLAETAPDAIVHFKWHWESKKRKLGADERGVSHYKLDFKTNEQTNELSGAVKRFQVVYVDKKDTQTSTSPKVGWAEVVGWAEAAQSMQPVGWASQ